MPEFVMPLASKAEIKSFAELDEFTQGYVEALFFTNTGSGDDAELEDKTFGDLAPDTLEAIVKDCTAFQEVAKALLEQAYERDDYSAVQAGRDFWFTRNGHGVGYWDRNQLEADDLGDRLSALCEWGSHFHQRDMYAGDDGKVYLS